MIKLFLEFNLNKADREDVKKILNQLRQLGYIDNNKEKTLLKNFDKQIKEEGLKL